MDHGPLGRLDPARFPRRPTPQAGDVRALREEIDAYYFAAHDAYVRAKRPFLEDNVPLPTRAAAAAALRHHLQPRLEFHKLYPFVVAPPGALHGGFPLHARQYADQQPIGIAALMRHLMLIGSSGAGKTTLAQQIAHEAYDHNLSVATFDGKDDAPYFLTTHPETLLIGPRTPIPLLEVPSWLSPPEYARLITRAIRRTWWGGQGIDQVSSESLEATYRAHDHPSVADWRRVLLDLRQKGDTYNRRDRIDAMAAKLGQLIERYLGIAATPAGEGISLDLLCTQSTYFGFRIHTEVEDFITNWLIELRFAHHRVNNIRALDTLNIFDESMLLLHENTISEAASIAPTFPLLREFGIACLLTTNNYEALPAAVKTNVSTHCVMAASDAREQKAISDTIGLTAAQRDYHATKLQPGQFLFKTAGTWQLPVLATFDDIRPHKHITPDEWHAAEQRTNRLARTRTPITVAAREQTNRHTQQADTPSNSAARGGSESTEQPTTVHATAPSSSPPSRVAPVLESIASNTEAQILSPNKERKEVPLNTHQRAFLTHVAEGGISTVIEAYDALGLKPMQGDRIRKKLGPNGLGLLTETRITVGGGRGKQATALQATDIAYNLLELQKPRMGRGSGPQHAWILRQLQSRIPHAVIEGLGGADVTFLVDPTVHEPFLCALLANADATVRLNAAVPVALEVELTTKHISENLARNERNGFAATIILTLPTDVEKATRCVERLSVQHAVVVLPVFRFLDALRLTEGQ